MEGERGYGLNAADGRGVLIPYARFRQWEGENTWQFGSRLEIGESLILDIEVALGGREGASDERTLVLQSSERW